VGALAEDCNETAVRRGQNPWLCVGGIRPVALLCRVGLFMAYGYRFAPEYGIRARLLSSQGEVLGEDELVLFGEGAVGDLGSPQACLLPDGRVAVVYYANNKKDAADDSAPRYIETAIV
jgi:hypothetical protein